MLKCYHVGYYLNKYAGWYRIASFETAIELIRFLIKNGDSIEKIDFLVWRID